MNKKTSKATQSSKTESAKPHFYSPEAKAERLKKRKILQKAHLTGLIDSSEVCKETDYALDEKDIKWLKERFLFKCSLKELEMLGKIFTLCELTGAAMATEEVAA